MNEKQKKTNMFVLGEAHGHENRAVGNESFASMFYEDSEGSLLQHYVDPKQLTWKIKELMKHPEEGRWFQVMFYINTMAANNFATIRSDSGVEAVTDYCRGYAEGLVERARHRRHIREQLPSMANEPWSA